MFPSNLTSLTSPCLGQHNRQPTPCLDPPGIAQPVSAGPRVAWVQHVLVGAGDPCAVPMLHRKFATNDSGGVCVTRKLAIEDVGNNLQIQSKGVSKGKCEFLGYSRLTPKNRLEVMK